MASGTDDLVQRQAAILAEMDAMHDEDLISLGNLSPLESSVSEADAKARKLLRSLARRHLLREASFSSDPLTKMPTIVPAQPGFFVIYLLPLSDGSYDREHVLQEPVIGWQVESGGHYVRPLIVGNQPGDRWAVLTPNSFVMTDEISNLFGEAPFTLKDWIKSEIKWIEYCNGGTVVEFPRICENVFQYSGPVAEALGWMMADRRDWSGTLEELYETLSKFQDGKYAAKEGWPVHLPAFAAALKQLEPKLADADLLFGKSDNGRLIIHRQSDESAAGTSQSSLQ